MLDIGFIGHVAVGGVLPLMLQCRDGALRVSSPTSAPTYVILHPGSSGSTMTSGSLGDTDVHGTGFRMGSLELGSGYQPGLLYTVLFQYSESGNARAAVGSFSVV